MDDEQIKEWANEYGNTWDHTSEETNDLVDEAKMLLKLERGKIADSYSLLLDNDRFIKNLTASVAGTFDDSAIDNLMPIVTKVCQALAVKNDNGEIALLADKIRNGEY